MSLGWKYGDRFIQYGDRSRSPFSLHCIELIMRRLSFLLHIDILCDSTWYSPAWCYEMTVTVTGTKPKPKILYSNKMRRLHSGALNAGSTLSAEHPTNPIDSGACLVSSSVLVTSIHYTLFWSFQGVACQSKWKPLEVSRPTTGGH